jgi:hypothetical protein
MGHFRPINDVCAMSAFHPIETKLPILIRVITEMKNPDMLGGFDRGSVLG